jgi:hypothetical protein
VQHPSGTVSPIAPVQASLPAPLGTQDSDLRQRGEVSNSPSPAHVAAAAVTPAPPVVVGSEIRYLGRLWTVERINHHPGHGPLMAISALDDDSFELICGKGCDGPFEVLA